MSSSGEHFTTTFPLGSSLCGKLAALALMLLANGAHAQETKQLLVVQTLGTEGDDKDLSLLALDLTEELVLRAASLAKPNGIDVRSESELRSMVEHLKDLSEKPVYPRPSQNESSRSLDGCFLVPVSVTELPVHQGESSSAKSLILNREKSTASPPGCVETDNRNL